MKQAILILLSDSNGQVTSHSKAIAEEFMQRRNVPAKVYTLDLDYPEQVTSRLGSVVRFVSGRGDEEQAVSEEPPELSEAQVEGLRVFLKREVLPAMKQGLKDIWKGSEKTG